MANQKKMGGNKAKARQRDKTRRGGNTARARYRAEDRREINKEKRQERHLRRLAKLEARKASKEVAHD